MGLRSGRVRALGALVAMAVLCAAGEVSIARAASAQPAPGGPPPTEAPPADVPAGADTSASPLAAGSGNGFHALVPARLLDSRTANGGWTGKLTAGATQDLVVTNRGGVPGSATAVIMNVTATAASAGSFVTVFPSGSAKPNASNLNFGPNQTVPNLVTVKVGAAGKVTFSNAVGAVHMVADVVGYFDDGTGVGDSFYGVNPARLLDTRTPVGGFGGPLGAGVPNAKDLQVRGQGGVPASATAVVLNVTSTNATAGSFLQVWPAGAARPNSSSLNFGPNETIPNLVVVQIGTGGKVSFYNEVGATDVVADVVAYFDPAVGAKFTPLAGPTRILDDRVNNGLTGPWQADQTRTVPVVGKAAIPAGASGVIMNTTVTNGTAGSFVSVFPSATPLPITSNLNFGPGQTIPNLVMAQLPPNGKLDIYNKFGAVDIIGDVVGYFALPTGDVIPPDPATTAPAADPTEPYDFTTRTSFLYSGPNPVQTFVTPGAIDPSTSSVVRGRVIKRDGSALSGVRVTAPNQPELGRTVTRANGSYDFVVNGGMSIVLQYEKAGFLPAQRHVPATALGFDAVEDVVLIPLDTAKTVVIGNSGTWQSAQSSVVNDSDGSRHNTVLFPSGTTAQMRMLDGSLQPINTMSVRATEYTVGTNGPNAMPGELPPNSGYTYAVELSVDEALAAGASTVEFSQPVIDYTENFIGFPAGTKIPTGYYDKTISDWVAVKDGMTVKIVSITGGKADLDVTGDDVADAGAALTNLGITDPERAELANHWATGTSLWRVPISHFSPWDMNHPWACQAVCTLPSTLIGGPHPEDDKFPTCKMPGSIIGCENQTLGERIGVTGTPFQLGYNSSSAAGYLPDAQISIPATGASLPVGLAKVEVWVDVAGQHIEIPVAKAINQTVPFTWDGLDGYGKPVIGEAQATVQVRYVYDSHFVKTQAALDASYGSPGDFDDFSITVDVRRNMTQVVSRTTNKYLLTGVGKPDSAALGGWGIDQHHDWHRSDNMLFLGTGEVQRVPQSSEAINATNEVAFSVAAAADGSAVFTTATQIKRRTLGGAVSVVAGSGQNCIGQPAACDEGLPAAQARLNPQQKVTLGPDGTVYFTDGILCSSQGFTCFGGVVRKIAADGTVHTVAGNGVHCASDPASCGDGVDATTVGVTPDDITVDGNGTLWIVENYTVNPRIRSVDKSGVIHTQYGCIIQCFGAPTIADGQPAANTLIRPLAIAAMPDGSIIFADSNQSGTRRRIIQITPDGIAHVVAGSSQCTTLTCGDGGPATAFQFVQPMFIAVDPDGTIYVADGKGGSQEPGVFIDKFRIGGDIQRIAGLPFKPSEFGCVAYHPGECGDGNNALNADLGVGPIAAARGDVVYLAQATSTSTPPFQTFHDLRVIGPTLRTPDGNVPLPSSDGSQVYVFDTNGRHLRTQDALSGATLLSFGYDGAGRLTTMTDRDGNVTTIHRNGGGAATDITAPRGQVTGLALDGNGHLATVVWPSQVPGTHTTALVTGANGLLTSLDAAGAVHSFEYDADGRLTKDSDATGGSKALTRSTVPGGNKVTVVTAQGRTSTFQSTTDGAGVRTITTTDAAGAVTTIVVQASGATTTTDANGVVTDAAYGVDPQWGLAVPVLVRQTESLPGIGVRTTVIDRQKVVDATDVTKLVSSDLTRTVNGRPTLDHYAQANRTDTQTSPEGQVATTVLDAKGRIVSITPAVGVAPITASYDALGQLTSVAQGPGSISYEYDARGRRTAQTDQLSRRTEFTYDGGDRLLTKKLPAGEVYGYAYDARGNLTSLTMPGGGTHQFTFDASNRSLGYTAPGTPAEIRAYSPDGDLTSTALPSGGSVTRSYDGGERATGLAMPGVAVTYGYADATGRLGSSSWSAGSPQGTTYGFQGELPTTTTLTGASTGVFTNTWNADESLLSLDLAGGPTESFTYDNDGAVMSHGGFTLTRGGPGRSPSSSTDGVGDWTFGYDALARINDQTVAFGGTTAFREQLVRNNAGQVTSATVTTPSGTHTYTFTYDGNGRLGSSKKDAGAATTYSYDAHGNLLTTPSGAATFDAGDRVQAVGATSYTYDANGNLTGRGADSFSYDLRSELLGATIGGVGVTYTYDSMARRTSRVQGGVTTEYLYGNPSNPFELTATRESGVLTRYFYEGRQPVAMERGGTRYEIAADHLGSPRVVIDGAGTTVKEIEYGAWGNVSSDSNPAFVVDVGYAAGVPDRLTGFVRFGFRDYDPASGRFVTTDPVRMAGGGNQYGYVGGDPVNGIDPAGTWKLGGGLLAGVGAWFSFSCASGFKDCAFCAEAGGGAQVGVTISTDSPPDSAGSGLYGEIGGGVPGLGNGGSVGTWNEPCGGDTKLMYGDQYTFGKTNYTNETYNWTQGKWEPTQRPTEVAFSKLELGVGGRATVKACTTFWK